MARWLWGAALPAVAVVAWEILWHVPGARRESLSRPVDVVAAFAASAADGTLLQATLETLQAALSGLAIAGVVGLAFGVLLGLAPVLERIVAPTIDALRPIPSVALIPLALMVFGFGASMQASVVAFACVWPVLLITIASVQGVEPRLLEVARALRMNAWQRTLKVVIPAAIGGIVVGLRLALAIALIVSVTVEIVINPRGLGHAMMAAQQALQFDRMYALLVWVGFLGWAVSALSLALVRRMPSARLALQGER